MVSDDEDDYMSAAFLNVKEDIRPGLVKSSIMKRKHAMEEKLKEANKRNKTKSLRQWEEERRNEGLDSSLGADNKGFAMLQKMGYKPGMKLGCQKDDDGTSSRGLQEPIRVQLKTDRSGLGQEAEIKRRIQEKEKQKNKIKVWKASETARLTEEFQQRMRDKVFYKHLNSDLVKLRKVCQHLDSSKGVEVPIRTWFWYSPPHDDEEDEREEETADDNEEEDEDLDPQDQLEFINDYLRSNYFYCVWCGTTFDNNEDMASNCPGNEKCDHE